MHETESISLHETAIGGLVKETKQQLKVTIKMKKQDRLAFFKTLKGKYDKENYGKEGRREGGNRIRIIILFSHM